ncbi:phosphoribosyltransferase [Rhodohalobacter mucosus]|uniref:Phosphoribosyltransferase n=1 Tax=Rhodohalobacter mucosus TaxID=2079485 RepID=A0A316TVK0_9BACT|nr:phosphoribosyltransferase [Rhodohalobacter mucosus]PWN06522.1 phosphoribosyltransferase [Rhodohalobacter mucosus]
MDKKITARIVHLPETYEMAYRIARQIQDTGEDYDVVVGISRGGLPPSRIMCDFLNIKTLTTMQILHYESAAKAREEVRVSDPVKIDLEGRNVLLVDDVNDSGDTLQAAVKHIQTLKPSLLKTAVLHEKAGSSFSVDYCGSYLSEWKWLIYQWAVTEDLIGFLERDGMLDSEPADAIRHLSEKYDLTVERDLLEKVLSMKEFYSKKDTSS